jgi:oligopeptide transport system permease protein
VAPVLAWVGSKLHHRSNISFSDLLPMFFFAVLTHPLLDLFTGYGTQILNPITDYAFELNTIFIIDPVYTLPFLVLLITALFFKPGSTWRTRLNLTGLSFSTAYLILTIAFKFTAIGVFERSLFLLFLAIGAVEWLTMARIVRGEVMALKRQEFVEACRVLGYGHARILFRHLLPNVLGTIIVYITLTIPSIMLLEAFLSFLGLGVQSPMASWGSLIKDGVGFMEDAPWLMIAPCVTLFLTLLALNFLGDGLRDALDPRRSGR